MSLRGRAAHGGEFKPSAGTPHNYDDRRCSDRRLWFCLDPRHVSIGCFTAKPDQKKAPERNKEQ